MASKNYPEVLQQIAQILFDKKAENIFVLDVRGVCPMTDFIVIAQGTVERHVKALSDSLLDCSEVTYGSPLQCEGSSFGDWIAIDYGEVMVHLLIPEMREYYSLEKLWKEGTIIDIPIQIHKQEDL